MTKEEFFKQQQQSQIQNAINNMANMQKPVQPIVEKGDMQKEKDTQNVKDREKDVKIASDYLKESAQRAFDANRPNNFELYMYDLQTLGYDINHYLRMKDALNSAKQEKNKIHAQGPGCLATVMSTYGKKEAWNKRFAENPEKQGFVKIPYDQIAPGDIVQFRNSEDIPTHAMMANTSSTGNWRDMRYSGSNGYDAVRKETRYPANEYNTDAYRFVGDKQDSLRWTNEYNKLYKK